MTFFTRHPTRALLGGRRRRGEREGGGRELPGTSRPRGRRRQPCRARRRRPTTAPACIRCAARCAWRGAPARLRAPRPASLRPRPRLTRAPSCVPHALARGCTRPSARSPGMPPPPCAQIRKTCSQMLLDRGFEVPERDRIESFEVFKTKCTDYGHVGDPAKLTMRATRPGQSQKRVIILFSVCVCVYMCACACGRAWVCARARARARKHAGAYPPTCPYTRPHTCPHACPYTRLDSCEYTCPCTCLFI